MIEFLIQDLRVDQLTIIPDYRRFFEFFCNEINEFQLIFKMGDFAQKNKVNSSVHCHIQFPVETH